ncbi:hypothetical protein EN46_07365 [Citrobacter amalonaticus]
MLTGLLPFCLCRQESPGRIRSGRSILTKNSLMVIAGHIVMRWISARFLLTVIRFAGKGSSDDNSCRNYRAREHAAHGYAHVALAADGTVRLLQ